ncbi:hypothetical protein [Massilia oculi]|uniref:hypothetical protein n=1 Tax=Massilia oculi TaxID=945844 RepID=UPI001AAE8E3C|nr:hypothetical protein [Massilia oculi]
MSNKENNSKGNSGELVTYLTFFVIIVILSLIIPQNFRAEITLSPLLLFGIIFVSNLSPLIIRNDTVDERSASWVIIFAKRFLVSVLFSSFLILISSFAGFLGR